MKKILSVLTAVTILAASIISTPVSAATVVNIAQFAYVNGVAEADMEEYGDKEIGYAATGGELKSSAKLYASVDGEKFRTMSWTKAEYTCNETDDQTVACIAASKKNNWAIGSEKYPFFLVECSTKDYENITFSANLGGSKKGPANYKLQYSIDNETFTDVGATVSVGGNKDMDSYGFNMVNLPTDTFDKEKIYIRIIATDYSTIGGGLLSDAVDGGEAAIAKITVSGEIKSSQTLTVATPTANVANNTEIYSDKFISFTVDTDGAQIKYQIDDGEVQDYVEPFAPFDNTKSAVVNIKAWAVAEGYENSSVATYTYTCTKDTLARFSFSEAGDVKYANGKIRATGGVYPTANITASLDAVTRFVPLFDIEENAIAIAPDDSYKWNEGGFWQFEITTAGYDKAYLSLNACSSKKGPASMSLKYSLDNVNYNTIEENLLLPVSSIDALFSDYELPSELADKDKVYIRLVIEEDKRANEDDTLPLFNNESKGNTFINDVEFTALRSDKLKMPYTTKKTEYFGNKGAIEYVVDGDAKYSIYTENGTAVTQNQTYSAENPIVPAMITAFDMTLRNKFRIDIWSENGDEKSIVNSKYYTYKGETIAEIEADETIEDVTEVTVGDTTLSMYPNGRNMAKISYSSKDEALRVSAEDDNSWSFDTSRLLPQGDGYWLIKTSTKGYKDITLSLEQMSTSKGPRDWCINYSTDNVTYYELENSSIRTGESLESSYTNIELPQYLDDLETVYIKIKIDGGENVGGAELSAVDDLDTPDIDETMVGKGNTSINKIEICGIKIENKVDVEAFGEKLEKGKTYYINLASETENPTVIIAGYDKDNNLVFTDVDTLSLTVENDSAVTSVKVMLWESRDSIKPLSPCADRAVE